MSTRPLGRLRRVALASAGLAALAVGVCAALFAFNGTRDAWRRPRVEGGGAVIAGPVTGPGSEVGADARGAPATLTVIALNAAKCGFHQGGLSFREPDEVRARLDRIADALRAEEPDLVLLSEVVHEAGPAPVDQVAHLARALKMRRWVGSDNYSFGLPFYRIRSGNAVLSRFELRAPEVIQLSGGRPFWSPTNNRRALFCEVVLDGEPLLVGALRGDSYDLANNARQMDEILAYVGGRPALLGGDFNADPHTPQMRKLDATGAFTPMVGAPPTYPASAPARRIDYVFAPESWTLVSDRVLDTGESDHLAVVATFAVTPR